MTKIIFSIVSYLPLGGLIFYYSFFCVLLLTHADVSSWMSQNPDVIGGSLASLFFPALVVSTFILVVSLAYYLFASLLGAVPNISFNNIIILLSTGVLEYLLLAYDPGGYFAWLLD